MIYLNFLQFQKANNTISFFNAIIQSSRFLIPIGFINFQNQQDNNTKFYRK